MAHEKANLVCDNKCFVEGMSKEEIERTIRDFSIANASVNGVIHKGDCLLVDFENPYGAFNKPYLVNNTCSSRPDDLLKGVRSVYWSNKNTLVCVICGIDTNQQSAIWTRCFTPIDDYVGAWESSWKKNVNSKELEAVRKDASAGTIDPVTGDKYQYRYLTKAEYDALNGYYEPNTLYVITDEYDVDATTLNGKTESELKVYSSEKTNSIESYGGGSVKKLTTSYQDVCTCDSAGLGLVYIERVVSSTQGFRTTFPIIIDSQTSSGGRTTEVVIGNECIQIDYKWNKSTNKLQMKLTESLTDSLNFHTCYIIKIS